MNEKILLVDDEETNLRLLTKWLVPLGYEVEFAANGEEAVRKVRKKPPDLVVLDIMMPIMDGHEACRILKKDQKTRNIPIIIVTALHDRELTPCGVKGPTNRPLIIKRPAESSPRGTVGPCRNILIPRS